MTLNPNDEQREALQLETDKTRKEAIDSLKDEKSLETIKFIEDTVKEFGERGINCYLFAETPIPDPKFNHLPNELNTTIMQYNTISAVCGENKKRQLMAHRLHYSICVSLLRNFSGDVGCTVTDPQEMANMFQKAVQTVFALGMFHVQGFDPIKADIEEKILEDESVFYFKTIKELREKHGNVPRKHIFGRKGKWFYDNLAEVTEGA